MHVRLAQCPHRQTLSVRKHAYKYTEYLQKSVIRDNPISKRCKGQANVNRDANIQHLSNQDTYA